MIDINGKKALSIAEVLEKLNCSDRWLRDKLNELGIEKHRIGKLFYVVEADLEPLLGGKK